MIVACGRPSKFRQQHAGLPEALVVALQAGEDQIEIFFFDCGRKRTRRGQRIELVEFVVGNVNAAVGALGESFLDGLLGALRTHRNRDDFAAVLFLQAQRFFERVGIRLVGFKSDVGFANPRAAIDNRERRIFGGNLLDANADFHERLPFNSATARTRDPSDGKKSKRRPQDDDARRIVSGRPSA